MNKTGIIVSGGTIDRDFALEQLKNSNPEIVIGVDSGLDFLYHNIYILKILKFNILLKSKHSIKQPN